VLGLAIWTAGSSSTARAGFQFVDMFRNDSWTQTGNSNALTVLGSFFSSDLNSVNSGDYDAAQMTYPGPGSPVALTKTTPTNFHYQTGYFSNQAAMDAAFPTGTYSFQASLGGGNPDTTSFAYTADHYPASMPYLTGTDYSALQGMDPHKPFTFHFSPFDPGSLPSGNASYIFFTIFDFTKNTFVYNQTFLPSTTTSLTLPANTLTPGDSFGYELIFDNRLLGISSPGAVSPAEIGYEFRTDGSFLAAIPEPTSILLLSPAAAWLAWVASRRRRRAR
jgi:hypothetical protein